MAGFIRVLENLESPGIFSRTGNCWEKARLVLESAGNLLTLAKNVKCIADSKED